MTRMTRLIARLTAFSVAAVAVLGSGVAASAHETTVLGSAPYEQTIIAPGLAGNVPAGRADARATVNWDDTGRFRIEGQVDCALSGPTDILLTGELRYRGSGQNWQSVGPVECNQMHAPTATAPVAAEGQLSQGEVIEISLHASWTSSRGALKGDKYLDAKVYDVATQPCPPCEG